MDKQELEFRLNQIVYENLFNEDECKTIESYYANMRDSLSYNTGTLKIGKLILSNNDKIEHDGIRKSKGKMLSILECDWILKKIGDSISNLNKKYFLLDEMEINNIDILEYGVNDEFKWHTDLGTVLPFSKRKISVVVFISDRNDYTGGNLEFMPKLKEPLKMERGYMVAFPSHKIHRVSPILSGTRRTLVTWLYGE